jgi:hypothetical protein
MANRALGRTGRRLSGRSRTAPGGLPRLAGRAWPSPDRLALALRHVAFRTQVRGVAGRIHSIQPQAVPGSTLGEDFTNGEESNNTVGGVRAGV